MERGGERVVSASNEITELTEQIGAKFDHHASRIDNAQKNLGDRSAGAMLAIARDAARDLDEFAGKLEPLTEKLRTASTEAAAGAGVIVHKGDLDSEEDAAQAGELIETLEDTENTMATTYGQIMEFAQSLLAMPHIDRRLTRSAKHAGGVVSATADVIANAQAEFTRSRGLLAERLDAYLSAST